MLTQYYATCYSLKLESTEIGSHIDDVLRILKTYVTSTLYHFLQHVDARDRGLETLGNGPTYLHTYFKSCKFDENKIYEVYLNKLWLTDALNIGREMYMLEIDEITEEIRRSNWNVVSTTNSNNNYAPKLLQIESEKSLNVTNALKVANQMQEAYKKYPIDGVIVQYYHERLSKVYKAPVYHIEIRMNDNNVMHMGEFLKDVCDISGGGHKNAAGGDLFASTLEQLFK